MNKWRCIATNIQVFGQTLSIENDPDKIVTFDKRSKRFEVIWNDESKINAEYYGTENRLPVDLID